MNVQFVVNLALRNLRAPRTSAWGISALIVGLLTALLSTTASAEPAAQAAPTATATPTARPAAPSCVTPQAQAVVVMIENPNPGDSISPGANVVIQGIAYDPAATDGTGVDKVSVYFGDRDAGGIFWGNAVLGQPNPLANTGQFATAGFSLRSPTIPTGNGGRTIFVYAHSSVSDREGIASVPVFLGNAPTPVKGQVPTPVLTPAPTCTPTPTAVPTSTSTPTPFPTFPPIPSVPVAPTPAPPTPAAPAPVAPAPATATPLAARAAAAPAAAAPAAVAPATATTAPRGGGIPAELGLLLLGAGTLVVGGGIALRRRERRGSARRQ